jgi:hypothetical protein
MSSKLIIQIFRKYYGVIVIKRESLAVVGNNDGLKCFRVATRDG